MSGGVVEVLTLRGPQQTLVRGTVFDPGTADTIEATVDWGDGTVEKVALVADKSEAAGIHLRLDGSHVYKDRGRFDVRVTATDDDGGVGEDSFVVNVGNTAPRLGRFPDSVSVDEGDILSLEALNLRFIDTSPDAPYVITVDWGDGTVENVDYEPEFIDGVFVGGRIVGEHRYYQDDEGHFVVTVSDGEFSDSNDIAIGISNVSPSFLEVNIPQATQGEVFSVDIPFRDPGALDLFTVEGTWGDGTLISDAEVFFDAGQGYLRLNHTFTERGEFPMMLILRDNGGGVVDATFTVGVRNAPPVVDLAPEAALDEGGTLNLKVRVTDTGAGDLAEAVAYIDWGDAGRGDLKRLAGAEPIKLIEEEGIFYVVASHTYADDGVYALVLEVVDRDGAATEANQRVTVANVAPTIVLTGGSKTMEGQVYRITATATDPGTDTIREWVVDWGDGTPAESIPFPNGTVFTHVFRGVTEPRTAKIVATATDEDGKWTSNTLEVQLVPDLLSVNSLDGEASGFHVRFDRAIDPEALNVYASVDSGSGPGDVVFRRASGAVVAGSLVMDGDNAGFRFVATGGALEGGKYSVSLRGGARGLADRQGGALDGNEDGIAGDDFVGGVSIDTRDAIVFSVPDFVRGAGQSVLVPNAGGKGQGLPLRIQRPEGIQSFILDIDYDPALLDIRGARIAVGLEGGVDVERTETGLRLHVFFFKPLSATDTLPVWLDAAVPENVPTGPGQILDLRVVTVMSGQERELLATADDAVQITGLLRRHVRQWRVHDARRAAPTARARRARYGLQHLPELRPDDHRRPQCERRPDLAGCHAALSACARCAPTRDSGAAAGQRAGTVLRQRGTDGGAQR